jgi:hypothetical protein
MTFITGDVWAVGTLPRTARAGPGPAKDIGQSFGKIQKKSSWRALGDKSSVFARARAPWRAFSSFSSSLLQWL